MYAKVQDRRAPDQLEGLAQLLFLAPMYGIRLYELRREIHYSNRSHGTFLAMTGLLCRVSKADVMGYAKRLRDFRTRPGHDHPPRCPQQQRRP